MKHCAFADLRRILFAACASLLIVSALSIPTMGLAKAERAEATCYRGEKERDDTLSACRIEWDFSNEAGSGATFWVQRLEIVEGQDRVEWFTVDGPYSTVTGRLPTVAEGGHLYRVVACGESVTEPTTDCASSTAMWAPIIVSSYEDIPQFLQLKDGSKLSAMGAKNPEDDPIEFLNIEYNVALLSRLVSFADVEALPPMRDLGFENVHHLPIGIAKWDGWLDYNLRRSYPVDPMGPHIPVQTR
jgi:hypothetical protein